LWDNLNPQTADTIAEQLKADIIAEPRQSSFAGFTDRYVIEYTEFMKVLAENIAAECLAGRSRVLSRALTAISDRALLRLGLKTTQFNLLVVLSLENNPSAICKGLQMEESTLSRNFERMRKRGWVRYLESPDRRSRRVGTTAKGSKLLEKAYPVWLEGQKRIRRRLGRDGTRALKLAAAKLFMA
jgi:DNA-binding MarR family transcriptional regulator